MILMLLTLFLPQLLCQNFYGYGNGYGYGYGHGYGFPLYQIENPSYEQRQHLSSNKEFWGQRNPNMNGEFYKEGQKFRLPSSTYRPSEWKGMVWSGDIGCAYPADMPEPFKALYDIIGLASNNGVVKKFETPIVVHRAHQSTYCQSNCVAYLDDTSLHTITKTRPPFSTPAKNYNSWSRMLCIAQCFGMLYPVSGLIALLSSWKFELLPPNKQLMECNGSQKCIEAVLVSEDYDPRLIGQVVYLEIISHFKTDGWNSLGDLTYDAENDSFVNCTTNCAPYSDITGYFPQNNPEKTTNSSADKYSVEGRHRYWQPLRETDDNGNFVRQEHVTPHIGYTAEPLLLSSYKEAQEPNYDYKSEADLVLSRLYDLSSDEKQKEMIRFFDNKLVVRGLIEYSLMTSYAPILKFEDHIMFLSGISSAEHDAILQSWREKVRFDLVRPTTVIQRWNNYEIITFSGDASATEPSNIKARDFQPFIRTMPHSEYPSGSASICTAYSDFTDLFTMEMFGGAMSLLPIGGNVGLSFGCNPPRPLNAGCGQSFHVQNMTELALLCGESRLWGGMHFTKSVEAGADIVSGLGQLAMDFVNTIKAGSNWTSSVTQVSADRPICQKN